MAKKKRKFFGKFRESKLEENQIETKSVIEEEKQVQTTQEKPKKQNSKILIGLKYVYITIFFALLAGFFHPFISGRPFDGVILGTLVLFVGLGGGVLVYKATTTSSKRELFLGAGFALIAFSLYMIFVTINTLFG